MSHFEYKQVYERNLPHIQPPGATLFVTFRLAGSIPQPVLEEWLREKKQLQAGQLRRAAIGKTPVDPDVLVEEGIRIQRRWFGKFEKALHSEVAGPVWLKQERVAEIVSEALHYRDGKAYRLDAFCIMPNHVHVVFAPLLTESEAQKLAESGLLRKKRGSARTQTNSLRYSLPEDDGAVLSVIMQSLKGYTARQCNLALGRAGAFWQHESFDHVVRREGQSGRIIEYVLNNPVKAGLARHQNEWKWSHRRPGQV